MGLRRWDLNAWTLQLARLLGRGHNATTTDYCYFACVAHERKEQRDHEAGFSLSVEEKEGPA